MEHSVLKLPFNVVRQHKIKDSVRALMQSELLSIWQRTPKTVIFVTHDVQEAVYLADRVAVMSARPGRIKAIVDTKFDKSDPAIFKNQGFIDKVDEIWNLVRIEAIKAQGRRHD
jgi:NitT/TauT family transport system ATP-binding protein